MFIARKDVPITRDRIAGYRAALEEHGIPFEEGRLLHAGYYSNDHGRIATQMLQKSVSA